MCHMYHNVVNFHYLWWAFQKKCKGMILELSRIKFNPLPLVISRPHKGDVFFHLAPSINISSSEFTNILMFIDIFYVNNFPFLS